MNSIGHTPGTEQILELIDILCYTHLHTTGVHPKYLIMGKYALRDFLEATRKYVEEFGKNYCPSCGTPIKDDPMHYNGVLILELKYHDDFILVV